ncbi:MAG: PIN domain-containing protein [Chloroflexi bacterium]|nr:PIN domain-containing protein [Chloroflexota bacterium]
MTVLVDSTIWSLSLRRRGRDRSPVEADLIVEWRALVREGRARLLGVVRQEVLSGVRNEEQFRRLIGDLREFPDESVVPNDYIQAADCFNRCRARGVQGSAVDFLICAVALRLNLPIFTTDTDFTAYAGHLPIALHHPRTSTT